MDFLIDLNKITRPNYRLENGRLDYNGCCCLGPRIDKSRNEKKLQCLLARRNVLLARLLISVYSHLGPVLAKEQRDLNWMICLLPSFLSLFFICCGNKFIKECCCGWWLEKAGWWIVVVIVATYWISRHPRNSSNSKGQIPSRDNRESVRDGRILSLIKTGSSNNDHDNKHGGI